MKETFISSSGYKVTVNIPDRTPEEQAIRNKEIEKCLIAIYRRIEKRGKEYLLLRKEVD